MEQVSRKKEVSRRARLVRFCRRNPLGAAGGAILVFVVGSAIFAPQLTPVDPVTTDMLHTLSPPSAEFLFGSDFLGRDVFSQVLFGGRISLYIGLVSTLAGTTIGGILGLVSASFGGRLDTFVQRVMDILMTFPTLILALVIMAVLGVSTTNVMMAIAVPFIPRANRIMRAAALTVNQFQYVEAARATGCKPLYIIFRHILPNCSAPYIVFATALLGTAISVEAGLSFLGFGVPPPAPSWGRSISTGLPFMYRAPWLVLFPSLVLALTVYSINLLGDALRDTLDPRLRQR